MVRIRPPPPGLHQVVSAFSGGLFLWVSNNSYFRNKVQSLCGGSSMVEP